MMKEQQDPAVELEEQPVAAASPQQAADSQQSADSQVGDDSPGESAATEPRVEELIPALEDARAKADENWDQFLRTRAELDNLKRRHARELEHARKFALDSFVRELLQVRDSLELGYDAAQDDAADVIKLREGTELTLKLLTDVMTKFGVEDIDPMGKPFDPDFHQAMSMLPNPDVPPNTVVQVIQKGYLLNGRLARPALVTVSQPG